MLLKDKYAIKVLVVEPNDNKELIKRRARFKKEIEQVVIIQNIIDGIVPIYDASFWCEDDSDRLLWYLMPKAETCQFKAYSSEQKLKSMLELGNCLKQLHYLGYAHRDIKPKNLLIYKNRVCLSDFGLVWNINDAEEHITEVNDRLGPMAIRPPELQPVENLDSVDYRASDVYMFAKTVWMVLKSDNHGFPREYNRAFPEICIKKDLLQCETIEPLHIMMEGATRYNFWERISIDDCIKHLENQLKVLQGKISKTILNGWKYAEQVASINDDVPCDEIIYKDAEAVFRILRSLAGISTLTFIEQGEMCCVIPFRKVQFQGDRIYTFEVSNPYNGGKRKTIGVAVSEIHEMKDKSFDIYLSTIPDNNRVGPKYGKVTQALQNTAKQVCLEGNYLIRITNMERCDE